MRVALTGGAGYIGSTLVARLLERGDSVVSVDNQSIGDYDHLRGMKLGRKADLAVGDIRDQKLLEEEWRGCDAVAHLAALPGLVRWRDKPEEAGSGDAYGTHR